LAAAGVRAEAWQDPFNQALLPGWTTLCPWGTPDLDFTTRPSWLSIQVQSGQLIELHRPRTAANYYAMTRLDGQPAESAAFGLVLRVSDDRYVSLLYVALPEPEIVLTHMAGGAAGRVSAPSPPLPLHLSLQRSGNVVRGHYKRDRSPWESVGELTVPPLGAVEPGLQAEARGAGFIAQFDYFYLSAQ
jgi:hypothetical protein